jgi:DNA polymerase III subunit epsilon
VKVLLLDFETTGIDTKTARPIEVAAKTVTDTWNTIQEFEDFIWESGYPAITKEVEAVTNIKAEDLIQQGKNPGEILEQLHAFGKDSHMVVAYNAPYDLAVYEAECSRHGMFAILSDRPWVCAMRDVPWFDKPKKLMYSALDADLVVDPRKLHRAMADVELMREMLWARGLSATKLMEYVREPALVLRAKVSFDDKQLAKDAGFSWEVVQTRVGERRFTKSWVKLVKESSVDSFRNSLPFTTEVLL